MAKILSRLYHLYSKVFVNAILLISCCYVTKGTHCDAHQKMVIQSAVGRLKRSVPSAAIANP